MGDRYTVDIGESMGKVRCPDCNESMVKSNIECDDDSGYYVAWLCKCEPLNE